MNSVLNRVKKYVKDIVRPADPRHRNDDFDWVHYTDIYGPEQADSETRHTLSLKAGDYAFDGRGLLRRGDIKPLHPGVRVAYESILRLAPKSVLEVGCGGGDHLHNLRLLSPGLRLCGCDISKSQLEFARRRHPDMDVPMQVCDITRPGDEINLPRVDLAFAITVIMHIQTEDYHKTALSNMLRQAERQVVLFENWTRHPFLDDIRSLAESGRLAWENLHIYYHVCEGTTGPHAMILSRTPLSQFPELKDYTTLKIE